MSGKLAEKFGADWVYNSYISTVVKMYSKDKIGYNYRISVLKSLSAVMPVMKKDKISELVVPLFLVGMKDAIPNVRFTVCKIIVERRSLFDGN